MIALAALSAALLFASAEPVTVTLNLETGAATGTVMVALYNSEAAYDGNGQPAGMAQVNVAAGEHAAVFSGLPAGDYAAKMFHDVNGNGRMDTNPFGMPAEPFAFSNNARGNMGPAGWDRAHFTASADVAQTIVVK